ncbi:MAG: RagB/SusD family nutrient uptake outer membrane protein [Bacteroidales bacterium]|nr:RagB/SusD family nutrient uptake outer membrane protein [Bacteroidales bacterium]
MKKHIVIPLIILGLLVSCQDYLEFPPEGEIPQTEFFNSQDDARQAVNAMYGYLRFWNISAFNYLILGSLPSDEILKGSSPGDGSWANDYVNFQHTKTQAQIKDFWTGRYEGINLSNQVITNIPGIEMNEGVKNRMIAEATFMRAFHYYYLVRAYGGVPLIKEVPAGPEGLVRTPLEETWGFIESDLRAAIPDLPETVPSNELGRTTKWAAKGLLAKVLMYREDWPECKTVSDDIINNGPFDLYSDFYQLFRPEQEFCQESLFEIVATQVPGEGDLSNSQFAEVQAVRGQFGWGWFVPTDELADAFDAAGDTIRKKVTILFRGDVTEDGDIIGGVDVMEGVDIPRYNGKAYVPSRIDRVTGPYGSDQNIRILRFADILLINAEAAIHTGGDAATPLNRVRTRANLSPVSNPGIEDVWEERRLELAGEQDRYWDLLRTGQAATVLAKYGFQTGKHELYPIPQSEVDLSGGNLEQNPGW